MTTTQKNDLLNRNRIQWRRETTQAQNGDYIDTEEEMGLQTPIVPGEPRLSSGEIEAIYRWEDDGGRAI